MLSRSCLDQNDFQSDQTFSAGLILRRFLEKINKFRQPIIPHPLIRVSSRPENERAAVGIVLGRSICSLARTL